jgi:monoamine oxidase
MTADGYDVIVVGAGFAGATTARELATRGLRVLVLEGRDRIGGRTFTSALSGGELVELGGTFVHWSQPHTWSEITRYGLVDDVVDGTETAQWSLAPHDDGLRWTSSEEQAAREARLIGLFFEGSREALPRPYRPGSGGAAEARADTTTVAERLDALDLSPGDRDLLTAFFGSHVCGPPAGASVLGELKWWAPAGHTYAGMLEASFGYRLRRGTVSLLSAILDDGGAEVRLGTPVNGVTVADRSATVTLDDGERITAGAVVLAVPSGVWPDLRIEPALDPRRLAAVAEGMQSGHVSKGYLVLEGEPRTVSVMPHLSHPITMMATSHRISADEQVMVFWGTEDLGDPNDLAAVDTAVRDLLPGTRVVETRGCAYHRGDRFSRGGWGLLKAGQQGRYSPDAAFSQPQGRLFFAGSDIATGWQGYIDGAIESGLRVARQVRDVLAPAA